MGQSIASAFGNGLEALKLILLALGIGPGDEVIVPAHTFIATWLAVSDVGATPVGVDIDLATYNIDPALIEAANHTEDPRHYAGASLWPRCRHDGNQRHCQGSWPLCR